MLYHIFLGGYQNSVYFYGMSYTREIQKLRDDIQKEIISCAVSTVTVFDGVLEFNNPVEVVHVDETAYSRVELSGVDISSGQLVDIKNEIILFKNLTVESLCHIHEVLVVNRSFTFKPDLFL